MFFRNLNLNANPERWNQRCFLFIQSVINAKLSLEFFHGLFINLPSLLIMKGCTILIRKKWPRWIFCFGDKTCIMKDSFIIRRCNYSGLHCIHSSKFNIQRRLYWLVQALDKQSAEVPPGGLGLPARNSEKLVAQDLWCSSVVGTLVSSLAEIAMLKAVLLVQV